MILSNSLAGIPEWQTGSGVTLKPDLVVKLTIESLKVLYSVNNYGVEKGYGDRVIQVLKYTYFH